MFENLFCYVISVTKDILQKYGGNRDEMNQMQSTYSELSTHSSNASFFRWQMDGIKLSVIFKSQQ